MLQTLVHGLKDGLKEYMDEMLPKLSEDEELWLLHVPTDETGGGFHGALYYLGGPGKRQIDLQQARPGQPPPKCRAAHAEAPTSLRPAEDPPQTDTKGAPDRPPTYPRHASKIPRIG